VSALGWDLTFARDLLPAVRRELYMIMQKVSVLSKGKHGEAAISER
jgi:hypothetical protein